MLEGVPGAGPAHAGLDLVEDEHQLVFVSQVAQSFKIAGRRDIDASLTLDGLDHDGTSFVVY